MFQQQQNEEKDGEFSLVLFAKNEYCSIKQKVTKNTMVLEVKQLYLDDRQLSGKPQDVGLYTNSKEMADDV